MPQPRALLTACLAVAVVVLALVPADAAPKGKAAKNKPPKGSNQAPDVQIIAELEKVHQLLSFANPRYAGHRVHAMAAIRKAIDALENDRGGGINHKLSRGDNKADETKQLSDAQVRAAGVTLQGIQTQIKSLPPAKYRTRAFNHLGEAQNQLTLALQAAAGRR